MYPLGWLLVAMETRPSASASACPHLQTCKWTAEDTEAYYELLQTCRNGTCSQCTGGGGQANAVYMCFMRNCAKLGCSRDHKGHAMKHYKNNPSHALSLNCMSLQLWCYACDDYITIPNWLKKIANRLDNDVTEITSASSSLLHAHSLHCSVGLSNMGNSCFINSALQVLFNCPPLMGFFRTCTAFVQSKESHSLSHHFLQLINSVHSTGNSSISPAKFIRVAAGYNPCFHGYSQQDAMDFIRLLLDRFHEELKYPVPLEAFEDQNSKIRRKSGRLASKNNEQIGSNTVYKSIISDTFSGYLRSEVQCHKCKKISIKDDQFFDLSLPLSPGPNTKGRVSNIFSSIGESLGISGKDIKLESALVNFCLPEVLDGKDRYLCEHCKEFVQSTKTLSLKSLPQILCLQLKRFRHDTYFSSKINTHVEFPLNGLDLRHFINKEFIGTYSGTSTEYDLLGFVNHRGSFNGGHYLAYCRNFETGNWLEFDDSRVRNVREEDIPAMQAYLLFYIRRPDSSFDLKSLFFEGLSSEMVFVSKQWYNRLMTCGNPGPVDSFDIICPHGNVRPLEGLGTLDSLLQPLPKKVASDFCNQFGELGGVGVLESPVECTLCVEEAEALRKRRRREEMDVINLDTSSINDSEFWYLIDSSWLQLWQDFKSGGPPPGPISNFRLLKSAPSPSSSAAGKWEKLEFRTHLIRGEHYRGINERVWNYLYNIYGGGPVLRRRTIDIYKE